MRTLTAILVCLSLSLVFGATAWARMGETESQIVQRYGKPFLRQHFTWCDKDNFNVQGFSVVVTLLNGVSVGELYHITVGNLTETQIVELLDANCEGFSWDEVPPGKIPKDIHYQIKQMWVRPNGSTAVSLGYSIEFKSINLMFAEANANKPPPAASTAGF
jgi:hypothetical protein